MALVARHEPDRARRARARRAAVRDGPRRRRGDHAQPDARRWRTSTRSSGAPPVACCRRPSGSGWPIGQAVIGAVFFSAVAGPGAESYAGALVAAVLVALCFVTASVAVGVRDLIAGVGRGASRARASRPEGLGDNGRIRVGQVDLRPRPGVCPTSSRRPRSTRPRRRRCRPLSITRSVSSSGRSGEDRSAAERRNPWWSRSEAPSKPSAIRRTASASMARRLARRGR